MQISEARKLPDPTLVLLRNMILGAACNMTLGDTCNMILGDTSFSELQSFRYFIYSSLYEETGGCDDESVMILDASVTSSGMRDYLTSTSLVTLWGGFNYWAP